MATATTATPLDNSTDANFRAWGSWLSGCWTTFGWTLVSQSFATGSDWTTVTKPGVANTARVTEVWRMSDSLQSTTPIFVTIDYGSASTLANPALRLRFHTAAAQGGNLFYDTGVTYLSVTANTNNMTHYASGTTSRFTCMMGASGTSWQTANMIWINVERRKTSAGVDDTNGFLIHVQFGGTQAMKGTSATGAHPLTSSSWMFPGMFSSTTDATFDGRSQVSPVLLCVGPIEMSISFVAVPSTAYAVGSTFTADILGGTHTYVASQRTSPGSFLLGGSSNIGCMLYE